MEDGTFEMKDGIFERSDAQIKMIEKLCKGALPGDTIKVSGDDKYYITRPVTTIIYGPTFILQPILLDTVKPNGFFPLL